MKILKFFSPTCGPCKVMESNLKAVDIPYEDIDATDENNDPLVEKYHIRNIPTIIMVNEVDEEVKRFTGVMSPEQLKSWIKE